MIYRPLQYVSEITKRGNNRPVSDGRKRPHSGSPGGHLFPVKRDRDLARLSGIRVWQEEPVVPRHGGTFCPTLKKQASNTPAKLPHNQGYLLSPVRLQNRNHHHWDKEIYLHRPDHCTGMLLHLLGSVAVCEHLWKRHHALSGVNSVPGTRRVNVWNLRHVQYGKRYKGDCRLESGSCSVACILVSFFAQVHERAHAFGGWGKQTHVHSPIWIIIFVWWG